MVKIINIDDPHEEGDRLDSFKKNTKLDFLLSHANDFIQDFDFVSDRTKLDFPLIFIVGTPRSGSTFLSQVLSRNLEIAYIDNLIARFWTKPILGMIISQSIHADNFREKITTYSKHGSTIYPWEPNEFGNFWRTWLNLDFSQTHKLNGNELSNIDQIGLFKTIQDMASFSNKPLLFKNLICGLQIKFLSSIFPNSFFIYVKRELDSTVNSILKCRIERYGSPNRWWSLKPSNYEQLKKERDPNLQVLGQVRSIQSDIETALESNIPYHCINHIDLINDPESTVKEVQVFLRNFGLILPAAEWRR